MYRITGTTILEVYKEKDSEKWEFTANDKFSLSSKFDTDYQSDFDNFLYMYNTEILEDLEKYFGEIKEGSYFYYVEIEPQFFEQCTMDGTDVDVEYLIDNFNFEYLGKDYQE
jgi:hypothetical protein